MIADEKEINKSETKVLPRMNTSSSINEKENKTQKPPNTEFSFSKNSFDISVSDKNIPTHTASHDDYEEPAQPTDPDQKYFRLGLVIQLLIILKILLCSVCLFKIQLLALSIILNFFGGFSVCQIKKKALITYMILLVISFIAKFYRLATYVNNSNDSEYYTLIISMLICIQITETIEGILLCVFSCSIFKMHESRINLLYNKNFSCCKKDLED